MWALVWSRARFDLEEDGGDTDEDDDWNSESFADEDEEDEDASETDEDEDADDWDTLEAKALEGGCGGGRAVLRSCAREQSVTDARCGVRS